MVNNQDGRVEKHPARIETEDHNPPGVSTTDKKIFIEPEISDPVDALKATTFFQTDSAGST